MNPRVAVAALALLVLAAVTALLLRWTSDDLEPPLSATADDGSLTSAPLTTPRVPAPPVSPPVERAGEDPAANGDHAPEEPGAPDDEGTPDTADGEEARGDDDEPMGSGGPPTGGAPKDAKPVGTLGKEAVQAAIKAVVPRVKACFEEGLKRQPDLAGRVVVQFEIEADDDGKGVVTTGEVPESETVSPFFDACVLKEVAGAEFPAPEGGGKVTVRYPFQFDPGGGFGGQPPEGQ